MSWQTYIEEHLMCDVEDHRLTAAAIIGHDGSVWAKSDSFPEVMIIMIFILIDALYGLSNH